MKNYPNGTYSSLVLEELKTDKVGGNENNQVESQTVDKNQSEKDDIEAKKMKEADAILLKET
jgi:hypothetical protein